MRNILILFLVAFALLGCTDQAKLEEAKANAARAEADREEAKALRENVAQQSQQNQQFQNFLISAQQQLQQTQADARAVQARADQATASAISAIARSGDSGVRIPTEVALVGMIGLIILGVFYLRRPAYFPPEQPTQARLLPPEQPALRRLANKDDPEFREELFRQGGYWEKERARDRDGKPVTSLVIRRQGNIW